MKTLYFIFSLAMATIFGLSITAATGGNANIIVPSVWTGVAAIFFGMKVAGVAFITPGTVPGNTARKPSAGVMSTQLISLQDFGQKPDVRNTLIRAHDDQYLTIVHLMRSLFLEESCAADSVLHYEEGWLISKFHSLYDIADPGPGVSATIYLTSDDIDPDTKRIYPRKGYTMFNALNESQSLILSVDQSNPAAPFIVVKPLGSYSIGAIAAGQELSIGHQVSTSGQGFPKSTNKSYLKRTSYIGLHKTLHTIQGGQIANKRWFDYMEGGKDLTWWNEGLMLAEYEHAMSEENAYMYGKTFDDVSTALTVPMGEDGEGNPFFTSKGIIPTIRDFGKLIPHTVGDFSLDMFYDLDTYWTQQAVGGRYVMCLRGNSLGHEMDKVIRAANAYTGASFIEASQDESLVGEWFRGDKQLAMSTEFNKINIANRQFVFHDYKLWSHPEKYNTAGSLIPHQAIFIPLSNITDAKTGNVLPNFVSRYKAQNEANRKYIFRVVAGVGAETAGSQLISLVDKNEIAIMANHGPQIQKANQLAMIDAVGA